MKYFIACLLFFSFATIAFAHQHEEPSLREKIGQMLIVGFEGKKVDASSAIVKSIEKNNLGGVILFDYNYHTKTFNKNIESPAQVQQLNRSLQYFNQLGNRKYHRPPLPLLITIDYEGGYVSRLGEQYGFPPTLSAEKIGRERLKEGAAFAESMAKTLKTAGFNLNFAPVVDLNVNPNNPIIAKKERSFSQNPRQVVQFARVFSQHFLNQHIQCAYKHFPGHGSSAADSHLGFVDVSRSWKRAELLPYQQLLQDKQACGAIIAAHLVNRQLDKSGLPATLSRPVLTDLLRHQLHFQGVIMTDDMQMKAISDHYQLEEALVLAINAGADVLIFGNNLAVEPQDPKQIIDIIAAKVRAHEISVERINDAYQHIVALKNSLSPQ